MEKLTVQFIVERSNGWTGLARRRVLSMAAFPSVLELDGTPLWRLSQETRGVVALPLEGCALSVNGKDASAEGVLLRPGDCVESQGIVTHFYIKHEVRPQSAWAQGLSRCAKLGVGVFLAVELLVMLALPVLISDEDAWSGSIARQSILQTLDSLRREIPKLETEDPLKHLVLAELLADLNERATYLRTYDDCLSPRQRRKMLADFRRIESVLAQLKSSDQLLRTEQPNIDNAVKQIIHR